MHIGQRLDIVTNAARTIARILQLDTTPACQDRLLPFRLAVGLRKELDEEERRWHLEVQNLQEGLRRRCLLRAYWRCHDGQEHHQASARDHGSLSRTLGRKNHGQTI